jgi:glutathione synthase/RimK-type ligase-like ATP-grasp enzyme
VVGGEAVAAMIRHGAGWVSNVAQGARCEPCPPDPELEALASAAALRWRRPCRVDLIRPRWQLQVLEVTGPCVAWIRTTTVISRDGSRRFPLARVRPTGAAVG